jgi:hypothetical protein
VYLRSELGVIEHIDIVIENTEGAIKNGQFRETGNIDEEKQINKNKQTNKKTNKQTSKTNKQTKNKQTNKKTNKQTGSGRKH